MASYVKFYEFVEQLGLAAHNFNTHTLKVALARSTDPPQQSDTVIGDITQPTGTGYAPIDVQNAWGDSSTPAGTATLIGTKCVFTAGGADWQNFRYVILYNDDCTSPADALIAYWDYGSDLTLGNGETFSVKFDGSETVGNIFTLS